MLPTRFSAKKYILRTTFFSRAWIPLFSYFLFGTAAKGCKGKMLVQALMILIAISGRLCLACTVLVFRYSLFGLYKHITGHPAHGGS